MTEVDISTKKCMKCKSVLPLTSFNKNKSKPDGLGTECRPCANAHSKKYHLDNLDAHKARTKRYREEDPQRKYEMDKRWRQANQEKVNERNREYRVKKPEVSRGYSRKYWAKNAEVCRQRKREYRKAFPALALFHKRTRQTRLINAMPQWADRNAMKVIYAESARLTKETGIKHHVDHYFPLKSDVVCGLHNEFNLRIIPAVENLSKGNRFPEDHP